MTQHDAFLERLGDYLDSELDERERRKLESHLQDCDECRRTLSELRALVRDARELPRVEPPDRVWQSIAAGIAERAPGGSGAQRAAWGGPFYAALALAATLVLGVGLWLAVSTDPREAVEEDPQALADMVTEELRAAESHYGKAIDGLEKIVAQNDGVLPQELAAVLHENLDLIESAIDESRSAISSNPESEVAQQSLLEALRRKVTLLQNTILLINEVRKGQGENALDLIDEMRKSSDPI